MEIRFAAVLQQVYRPYLSVAVRCCPYPSVQLHSSTWHPRIAPAAHRSYPRPPPLLSALSQRSSRFIVRTCPLMSVDVRICPYPQLRSTWQPAKRQPLVTAISLRLLCVRAETFPELLRCWRKCWLFPGIPAIYSALVPISPLPEQFQTVQ